MNFSMLSTIVPPEFERYASYEAKEIIKDFRLEYKNIDT